MSSLTVWDQVLSRIEDQVGKHSFSTWFKPTVLLADVGQSLSIRVPNPLFVEWLPKHYSVVLAEALRDVGRPEVKLVFVPDGTDKGSTARVEPVDDDVSPESGPGSTASSSAISPSQTGIPTTACWRWPPWSGATCAISRPGT